jgi:SAM-dependent methyltransferase
MAARYDTIGTTYTATRRPDPRVEARLRDALGGARRVLNVGAGAGSYEAAGPVVAAVEPSPVMIAQRGPGAAPVARGVAEHLPFRDGAFDAALAIFTLHHWTDWRAGIAEVRRVAGRLVMLTWDPEVQDDFWLAAEYLPEVLHGEWDYGPTPTFAEIDDVLGGIRVETVPIPADCVDGFFACYWARPEAYLDPMVRAGISCFALLDPADVDERVARLARDLESGAWDARHPGLRDLPELDVGYRLVVSG